MINEFIMQILSLISRKFMVVIFSVSVSVILVWKGKITSDNFENIVIYIAIAFITGNVADKIVDKFKNNNNKGT